MKGSGRSLCRQFTFSQLCTKSRICLSKLVLNECVVVKLSQILCAAKPWKGMQYYRAVLLQVGANLASLEILQFCVPQDPAHLGVDIGKTTVIPKQSGSQISERWKTRFGSAALVKVFTLNLPNFLKSCQAIARPTLSPRLSSRPP